jgi:hypothetical protein
MNPNTTKIFVILEEEGSDQTNIYEYGANEVALMPSSSKGVIDKLLLQFQNVNYWRSS